MNQDMFAQTMPLFGAGPNYRAEPVTAAGRRKQPAFIAVGSSCRVSRSPDDGGASPSVSTFGRTYSPGNYRGDLTANKTASTKLWKAPRSVPRVRMHHARGTPHNTSLELTQLIWEEEVARLKLQCSEQEKRIDLALLRPFQHHSCCPDSCKKVPRSAPLPQRSFHSFPTVTKGKVLHSPQICAATDLFTERHDRWASLRAVLDSKRDEGASGTAGGLASGTAPLFVRDSELLRALRLSEARIRELEVGLPARETTQTSRKTATRAAGALKYNSNGKSLPLEAPLTSGTAIDGGGNPDGKTSTYPFLSEKLVVL